MTHSIYKASLWMIIALTGFSFMAVAARDVTSELSTYHILFFRSLFALFIISFVFSVKGWSYLKLDNYSLHFNRNLAHFIGQYGWFYGIAVLPLADVFALEFTVPIWTAIAAYFLINESINRYKLIAIFLGLVGVIIILRPGIEIIHPAAFAVLLGAASYGVAHTLTRKLTLQTNILSILFFMSFLQLFFSMPATLYDWKFFSYEVFFYLVLITLLGLIAHYAMSRALALADATVVIPMDFLRLPLIIVLAYWLYDEGVDVYLIIGALIMLAGNMINVYFNARNAD